MDRVAGYGEIYRLFTCALTFSTLAELVLGLVVLAPLCRRYEREMGTPRFGTYCLISSVLGGFLELVILSTVAPAGSRFSGPYPLLGSVLYLFHRHAPRLYPRFFGMLGFDLSEKSLTYFFALQMLLGGGWATLRPALCGAVAGFLATSPVLPLGGLTLLPDAVLGWLDTSVTQLVPGRRARFAAAAAAAAGGGQGGRRPQRLVPGMGMGTGMGGLGVGAPPHGPGAAAGDAAQRPPAPPPPSEEAIAQLMALGFERPAVLRALGNSDNNVEVAANRLLGGE